MEDIFKDITRVCISCGEEFVWTAGEQAFLQSLLISGKIPFIRMPKRCRNCKGTKVIIDEGKETEAMSAGDNDFG
jgi:hypothetical protein